MVRGLVAPPLNTMSVFTNAASRSADQATEYVSAVLGLLGTRDPVDVLASTPDAVRTRIGRLSASQLAQPESPGKWSIGHVVRHLADSEIVWGWRLRMILAHDRPLITGYDQDLWADRLGYADADPRESLEEFSVLRRSHLRLLSRATPADLARVGVHAERGEERIDHVMKLYAGHDLLHLNQIDRIAGAVGAARP
jgi:hypothetical protein